MTDQFKREEFHCPAIDEPVALWMKWLAGAAGAGFVLCDDVTGCTGMKRPGCLAKRAHLTSREVLWGDCPARRITSRG